MISKKYFQLYILIFFSFCANFQQVFGQNSNYIETVFEVLTKDEFAKITLDVDMTTLLENRKLDDYYPALLTMSDGKSFQVKVKAKGRYRRKVAEIPPLKIKFNKKSLLANNLDTLNEVRLVFPCYDNNFGDELIVREYLAYRMFEHLTSACVRARLVRLAIRDAHVEKSRKNMYAILLEDNEETAARLNGYEIEQFGMPMDSLVQHQAALVAMFQYMIGNTDWDIAMQRNVRLIKSKNSENVLVIPYDFDFSGFVSAPYASPSSDTGLQTVRDRFLMANGINRESLRRATQILRSARSDFFDICRSRYLSKESASELIMYLETFYQQIDNNGDVPWRMKVPVAE